MNTEDRKSARQIHDECGTSLPWFQFAKVIKETLPHWEELRVVAEKKGAGRAPFDYLLNGDEEKTVLDALPSPRKKKTEDAPAADEPADEDAAVPEVCDTAEPAPEPERSVPSATAVKRAVRRAPKAEDVHLLMAGILDTHAKSSRQAVEHLTEALHVLREDRKKNLAAETAKDERITELLEDVAQLTEALSTMTRENERVQKELAGRPAQQFWGRRGKSGAGCER